MLNSAFASFFESNRCVCLLFNFARGDLRQIFNFTPRLQKGKQSVFSLAAKATEGGLCLAMFI